VLRASGASKLATATGTICGSGERPAASRKAPGRKRSGERSVGTLVPSGQMTRLTPAASAAAACSWKLAGSMRRADSSPGTRDET
jgi:hypothetical protein